MKSLSFTLTMVDCVIRIILEKSRFEDRQKEFQDYIRHYYSVYLTPNKKKVDFTLTIRDGGEDILLLKKKNTYYARYFVEKRNNFTSYYFVDEKIIDILVRMSVSKSLKKKGLMLHASSIIHNNTALLFCAPSGVGKSTLAQSLSKKYTLFTDDLVCLVENKKRLEFFSYQIPIPEKNFIDKSLDTYPLSAIFFLKRGGSPHIKKIVNRVEVYNLLVAQLWTEQNSLRYDLQTLERMRYMNIQYNIFTLGKPHENLQYLSRYIENNKLI